MKIEIYFLLGTETHQTKNYNKFNKSKTQITSLFYYSENMKY